ncbi:hypothetical protein DFH07DRAFT_776535 [Mycena maculata]|uniref:Uncharacterized protein n=1 Tax=Mycena maculata TaxID=230809 RepID=A0AAD7ILI3_9AGAR|nr:hypothetical protein DFH07DRAFT_776535 [Mycena maculata]
MAGSKRDFHDACHVIRPNRTISQIHPEIEVKSICKPYIAPFIVFSSAVGASCTKHRFFSWAIRSFREDVLFFLRSPLYLRRPHSWLNHRWLQAVPAPITRLRHSDFGMPYTVFHISSWAGIQKGRERRGRGRAGGMGDVRSLDQPAAKNSQAGAYFFFPSGAMDKLPDTDTVPARHHWSPHVRSVVPYSYVMVRMATTEWEEHLRALGMRKHGGVPVPYFVHVDWGCGD